MVSILAGAVLLWRIKSQFYALKKEHRIVEHIATHGDILQPEYSRPTPECPHPERWHMYDSMTAEVEVLDFLEQLVKTVKPELIVETGTFSGLSTLRLAQGLKANGVGRVITCEFDAKVFAAAKQSFDASGLGAMDRRAQRIQPGHESGRHHRHAVLRQRCAAAGAGSAPIFAADESLGINSDARRKFGDEDCARVGAATGGGRIDYGVAVADSSRAGAGAEERKLRFCSVQQ